MAIGGGLKIFDKSLNYTDDGATATATSGSASATFILDRNPLTFYRSASASDATPITITMVFSAATPITRLFLINHNFKQYTIQYKTSAGGALTDFTSVVGIDGAYVGGITETVYARNTSYYEFASVSPTHIVIVATSTQVANSKKYLSQLICTTELGTLSGYPGITGMDHDRNARKKQMLSGKFMIDKSEESVTFKLEFKNYPPSYATDLDLVMTLQTRETPFLVWLCGGRVSSTYFRYALRGFRAQDIYLMQVSDKIKMDYYNNLYTGPVNALVPLEEVVL